MNIYGGYIAVNHSAYGGTIVPFVRVAHASYEVREWLDQEALRLFPEAKGFKDHQSDFAEIEYSKPLLKELKS
jgi:hypothetical protein